MAKRSKKYGRPSPRAGRGVVSPSDYQASDNDITLVQPEREPVPIPMAENWDREVVETVQAMPTLPGGYFDFVQQYAGNGPAKPFMLTRPSPAPPEPRAAAAPPPPPPPPEPRPRGHRTTELPPPFAAAQVEMSRAPIRPAAMVQESQSRNLPSTMPPPVAIEALPESVPPPASGRAWASMFTIGPLSALVAALVSSLVWSLHTNDLKTAALAEKPLTADAAQAPAPCTTRPGENSLTTSNGSSSTSTVADTPASLATALRAPAGETPLVSVDSLPTMGSKATFASDSPVEAAPRSRASRSRAFAGTHSRPTEVIDATRAASAAEPAAAPPAPALPQGPDRGAVAKAMARAVKSASSCDTGPQDGRVSLTIAPNGSVTSVSLVKGFGDAGVNACVLRAFGRAKIPAYEGDAIQVRKAVRW